MPAVPQVTKSNGGVMSAELGKVHCAQMIMSGTAAGVIGASYVARLSGFRGHHEPRYRRNQRRRGHHS